MGTTLAAAAMIASLLTNAQPGVRARPVAQLSTGVMRSDSTLRAGTATAIRARPGAPHLDGRLDDEAWLLAPVMSGFTQRDPNDGQPATQRTEVRVVFTDDALYVGVRAFDTEPDRIAGQLTRRDADSPSDWIAVGVDSYHDRRTAFVFQVNPVGVKRDSYLYNDTDEDDSWDAVWDVATSRDADGWTAEYRIPFSQLRFAPGETHAFGFQVMRRLNRNNEESFWRPMPKSNPGLVSLFGTLEGITGITPPRRLEILPYTVARGSRMRAEAGNPFQAGSATRAELGADLKYGLTSNLTLDLTVNPDFGQVDADPAVVNLSAFESFFPERRPFFTEGVNLFRFGLSGGDGDGANEQLFYSRRIGRAPQGSADARGGFAERVTNTSILGAAKLSGKTPGGWSIGLLSALTAEEHAGVRDSAGLSFSDVVEPRTSYTVGRLARDMRGGHTTLGLFGTFMHRSLTPGLEGLRSDAVTIGADWNHRFNSGAYRFEGKVVGSNVRGSTEALLSTQLNSSHYFQRPDQTYLSVDSNATQMSGFLARASLGKENGLWRWATGFDARSPGFEVNDMGFMRQADYASQFVWVSRRWLTPGSVFRRAQVNINQWSGVNFGGERTDLGGNINLNGTFTNYFAAGLGLNRNAQNMSRELRGGPGILRPGGTNAWLWFESDSRKPLTVSWNGWAYVQDENAVDFRGMSMDFTWRPSGRLDLTASPGYDGGRDEWQYIDAPTINGATTYLFGTLRQSTVSMQLRANLTFTPTLTLQVYAQPFYARGAYGAIKRVSDPRAGHFADRFDVFGADRAVRTASGDVVLDVDADGTSDYTISNPDYSYVSLRSNVVLRWEYRAGSTIFLVWQQNRSDFTNDARYDLGAARRSLTATRPENVFLIKMNYWLSL